MDLELDENQRAIADLALQILRESLTRERLRAIEATEDRKAADEWKRLADAGLLAVPLAEDVGGTGLGVVEACLVLEQIGRTDRKSTRLNSSHVKISYAVFCL